MSRSTYVHDYLRRAESTFEHTTPNSDLEVPKLIPHFFYSSSLPIDDPLSATSNSSVTDFKSLKQTLQPFLIEDCEALERTWCNLISDIVNLRNEKSESSATNHGEISSCYYKTELVNSSEHGSKNLVTLYDAASNSEIDDSLNIRSANSSLNLKAGLTEKTCKTKTYNSERIVPHFEVRGESAASCPDHQDKSRLDGYEIPNSLEPVVAQNSEHLKGQFEDYDRRAAVPILTPLPHISNDRPQNPMEIISNPLAPDIKTMKAQAAQRNWETQKSISPGDLKFKLENFISEKNRSSTLFSSPKSVDAGTTGNPFVKLRSRRSSLVWNFHPSEINSRYFDDDENEKQVTEKYPSNTSVKSKTASDDKPDILQNEKSELQMNFKKIYEVPVGISRLHLVKFPSLQMKPIYWSPVNDTASVTRGTWFYQDTMYPVEPAVANQLEFGYRELKPWSQTWKDELESALSVGAAGEEKIVYRLWPSDKEEVLNRDNTQFRKNIFSDPYCAAEYFSGEIAAEGSIDFEANESSPDPRKNFKKYLTAQIIYKDSRQAFILKPNLQPSAYYGKRPLQKISKGIKVGIAVVRGFDLEIWIKLHPGKKLSAINFKDKKGVTSNSSLSEQDKPPSCPTCKSSPEITDLVLVVHGIGQKLSERKESFNFTHAVNDFRRSMNNEMSNSSVKRVLRKDGVGLMVLPVNWRSNLSFEDGGLMKDNDLEQHEMDYSLRDVTQESLPAVRQMISDVMLDIPYYMSRHKPKMIQAVIQEANRVYYLWCKNNQNFEKRGRVHLIAHSLGSAMVLEILSKQPNSVPQLDLSSQKINTEHFDFKTTNCFFAGSPAGFFLLLEQGKLLPRRGFNKPDAEHFNDKTVTGEVGNFGCMALENIYNVMHYNDPIAYRLNPTVDRRYAESLKEAQLPSTSTGLFENIGRTMRSIASGITSPQESPIDQVLNQFSMTHFPTNMEMEVHDFSREETAEKKFNLLNDNGQIDWYMNSGRGPLEIQYLNMLGAHSSYWANSDFVRMVAVECGRKPGKNNSIPSMRAIKESRIGKRPG